MNRDSILLRGETMTKKKILIILMVMISARIFTLPWLPIMDPSEGRYATISKTMSTTGDYITPKIIIDGKLVPFWGKPPLFFWGEALCIKLFGANEFSSRLPSALSGIALLLLLYWIVSRYHGLKIGATATFITFSSGAFFFMSGLVLLDMMLVLFSCGAWLLYYAFLKEESRKNKKLFSIAIFIFLALGFMVKGPVALAMFGVPVFFWTLLNKRWSHLADHAWVTGSGLFLVLTVPWFIVAEQKTPGFLNYFFIHENLLRFIVHKYGDKYGTGHEFPHGMSILFMLAAAAPWTAWIALMIAMKVVRLKKDNLSYRNIIPVALESGYKSKEKFNYFAVAFISITLFWCFAKQMLLYYLLPAIPAFSIWAAFYFQKNKVSMKSISRSALLLTCIYCVTLFAIYLSIGKSKSTKNIVQYIKNIDDVDNIVFVRRVPFSAYFYGEDLTEIHPKEEISVSLDRGVSTQNTIYVVSKHYRKRFFDKIAKDGRNFQIIYKSYNWLLAKKM